MQVKSDNSNVQKTNTKPKILVIEDNPDDLRVLANFIRDLGTVQFASNGKDGVRMAMETQPDLILLDIELPDIIGPVVYKQIRDAHSEVPVIFVTSHTGLTHKIAAMESGAKDFISKPFDPEVIRASIQTLLENKPAVGKRDYLTQAYHKDHFDEYFPQLWKQQLEKGQSLGLAFIYLDQLQAYTDSFGDFKADNCLKKAGGALAEGFGRKSELLARIGSDLFAQTLANADQGNIEQWGHWLVQSVYDLAIRHDFNPKQPYMTASVGICLAPAKGAITAEQILAGAQRALDEARKGQNQFAVVHLNGG